MANDPRGGGAPAVDPAATDPRRTVILLGPQQRRETLAAVLEEHGIHGPLATVTAGWQEREGEVEALERHLEGRSENLRLYRRAEEVFAADPQLEALHRERQARLRELQRLYNVRVRHAMAAVAELARKDGDERLLEEARAAALEAVRRIDAEHLRAVRRLREEYDRRARIEERSSLRRHRAEVAEAIERCEALAVAGGHVAVLLNRLRLFGVDRLIGARPVVGWSGGAMVLARRVVLYHDSPPQGPGNPEVLEAGLDLVRGVVPLPHAGQRLRLDDRERVMRFARRFAPDRCVALDDGARLTVGPRGWCASPETCELRPDGTVVPMEGA